MKDDFLANITKDASSILLKLASEEGLMYKDAYRLIGEGLQREADTIHTQTTRLLVRFVVDLSLAEEFVSAGIRNDCEPNALGIKIQRYIDQLNALSYRLEQFL